MRTVTWTSNLGFSLQGNAEKAQPWLDESWEVTLMD